MSVKGKEQKEENILISQLKNSFRLEYEQGVEKFLEDNYTPTDDAVFCLKALVRLAKSLNPSNKEEDEIDYLYAKIKMAIAANTVPAK